MKALSLLLSTCALVLGFSFSAFANPQVTSVKPTNGELGKIAVQIPAESIYQYTPVILCDSLRFQLSHFSSFYKDGRLYVDLRYETKAHPQGAVCSVFFVEDHMEEFDFGTGQPLQASSHSFRFVIQ